MFISNKKEPFFLLIGDFVVFALSLWISLALRGSDVSFISFSVPFSFIFIAWIIVFFISGLYNKYTTILKDGMSGMIFNAQLINSGIAFAFFYLVPYFGIAPKTILFLDLIVTFILIYIWRIYSHVLFGLKRKIPAIIVGSGEEMQILEREVNNNSRLELNFVSSINPDNTNGNNFVDEIIKKVSTENISVIVIDLRDERVKPILPHLYNLIFSGVTFIDMYKLYEDLFDREPLTLVKYNWFLENISLTPSFAYDFAKRSIDILSSVIIGILFLISLLFVSLAIKIEDGGRIFFTQERIGKNNKIIKTLKFRSMSEKEDEKITNVGIFLRKTRIDELPQFWNLFVGEISLIGPRPETPKLAAAYEEEIPYYNIRHLIKPGLSGWAQIYQRNPPKYGVDFSNTKDKLSYDLYYVKNRSIMLDLNIALKTIKELISRKGK